RDHRLARRRAEPRDRTGRAARARCRTRRARCDRGRRAARRLSTALGRARRSARAHGRTRRSRRGLPAGDRARVRSGGAALPRAPARGAGGRVAAARYALARGRRSERIVRFRAGLLPVAAWLLLATAAPGAATPGVDAGAAAKHMRSPVDPQLSAWAARQRGRANRAAAVGPGPLVVRGGGVVIPAAAAPDPP